MTGTGFPEVDAYNMTSYWTLLVATKPTDPQLCIEAGNGGAAVQPAMLKRKRGRRDASSSSEEEGGAGGAGGARKFCFKYLVPCSNHSQNHLPETKTGSWRECWTNCGERR